MHAPQLWKKANFADDAQRNEVLKLYDDAEAALRKQPDLRQQTSFGVVFNRPRSGRLQHGGMKCVCSTA